MEKTIVDYANDYIRDNINPLEKPSPEAFLRMFALEAQKQGYKVIQLIEGVGIKGEEKEETPAYAPLKRKKVKVDFYFPHKVTYPYDGYGRIARFFDGAFEPNLESKTRIILGHPREITKIEGTKDIFFTMFEADKIPERWADACNRYGDAVIVPSKFCEKVFKESGVKVPIKIVPLYADDFTPVYPDTKPFTFAHQNSFVEGGQKGTDLVLRAFLNVFHTHSKEDVRLILKGRNHRWANDESLISEASKSDKVKVILADMTEEEMEKYFWQSINCFVYPSRGEGFGLPPLEAMARGIPTILTKAHSMADFADLGVPIGIKEGVQIDAYYVGRVWDFGIGKWVEPDIKQVEKYMWDIYSNYQKYKEEAIDRVSKIKKLYAPEVFIENLIKTVKQL